MSYYVQGCLWRLETTLHFLSEPDKTRSFQRPFGHFATISQEKQSYNRQYFPVIPNNDALIVFAPLHMSKHMSGKDAELRSCLNRSVNSCSAPEAMKTLSSGLDVCRCRPVLAACASAYMCEHVPQLFFSAVNLFLTGISNQCGCGSAQKVTRSHRASFQKSPASN